MRPKLEYASSVWNDCSSHDANLLEQLQLDAARVVTGAKRGTSHNKLYDECGWPLLSDRRDSNQIIHFFKMVNNKTPPYLSALVPPLVVAKRNNMNLRNMNKFVNMKARTQKFKKSFLPNVVNLWNNLDNETIAIQDIDVFKNCLFTSNNTVSELFMHGSRKFSMIHSQLRMQCSNLNADLHKLHVLDFQNCICGYRSEDARHYLLYCPLYDEYRGILENYLDVSGRFAR